MDEKLTFESAVAKLEAIVDTMEKGEIALEKALELFSEGKNLLKYCQGQLTEAEKKLQVLEKDNNGKLFLKGSSEPENNSTN